MKGYSKIKGSTPFIPRSQSNKEFLFLDKDYDLIASKSLNKQTHWTHEHQEPRIIQEDHNIKKNDAVFLGKTDDCEGGDQGQKSNSNSKGGVLKRNVSLSFSKTTTNSNSNKFSLERQSSTRAIQEAVKRAFSIKRSSSVNSDRYSRIYDQPSSMNVDDFDHNCDYVFDNDHNHDDDANHGNQGYDFERLETRSMKKNHHNYGSRHVGSKVVRACKRLFSR